MTRIDPDTLATHLEVALSVAPATTLEGLKATDCATRRYAAKELAYYLTDRLGCFEVTAGPDLPEAHPSLFPAQPLQ